MAASDFVFVIDDFAPAWLYDCMINEVCNDRFPWMYPATGIQGETDPNLTCFGSNLIRTNGEANFFGANSIYYLFEYFRREYYDMWPVTRIERLRANMYAPGQHTRRHHDSQKENMWALLYYLTDTDGGTEIEGVEYEHKPNRAVIFPADMQHQARPATIPARVTLNWNFEAEFDYDAHKKKLADK
jgi:hypothetical protein